MSLKQHIESKLNEAFKAKDKNTYPTLRLVVSAIKDAEIAGRSKGQKEVEDSDVTAILKKMIKDSYHPERHYLRGIQVSNLDKSSDK